jgi:hypothetical protein
MKSSLRRAAVVMTLVVVIGGLNLVVLAPAFAMCPSDYGWQVTGKSDAWMLTGTYSSWTAGPGSIAWSKSTSDTRGTVQSVSIDVSVSYVLASAHAKYGATWSSSTTKTNAWTYTISIPSGQTARMAVYKRGSRLSVQKYTDYSNCTTSWSPVYYQYSPYASIDNSSFCIAKDPYPGTTYVFASGCGH